MTPHDGKSVPVPRETKVRVQTASARRRGSPSQIIATAGEFADYEVNPWIWERDKPAGAEIVAWRIEEN